MDFTAGIFEDLTLNDEQGRVAARQAVSVAHKRAKDRFGAFLAQSQGDFHQRFALVEDELEQVAHEAAEEFGGDAETILASVTSVLAAGGFCDDCRKWKSGPKAGCECGDDNASRPEENDDEDDASEPKESAVRVASWTVIGEALETVDLPTGDDTALGAPSPKMDKGEWKPNALNPDGNLSPIDTEGAGSPHPTVRQDVATPADHTKDFLEQTDAVTEHQDAGKETGIDGTQTDTWSGMSGQADPVTSAAQDVERNPLRTMMENGAIPAEAVGPAIEAHEATRRA